MASTKAFQAFGTSSNLVSRSTFCYNLYVYNFQKQNSEQTLREGLEEFYSINTQFRDLAEKDNPNAHIFKEHDYTPTKSRPTIVLWSYQIAILKLMRNRI